MTQAVIASKVVTAAQEQKDAKFEEGKVPQEVIAPKRATTEAEDQETAELATQAVIASKEVVSEAEEQKDAKFEEAKDLYYLSCKHQQSRRSTVQPNAGVHFTKSVSGWRLCWWETTSHHPAPKQEVGKSAEQMLTLLSGNASSVVCQTNK